MKRILIVQSDDEQAKNLSATIAAQGEATVSFASTVREACLLVAQAPYDIVLVDDEELEGAQRALHALQPDLPLKSLSLNDLGSENGMRLEELFSYLFDDAGEKKPQADLTGADDTLVMSTSETLVDAVRDAGAEDTIIDGRPKTLLDETLVQRPEASPSLTQAELQTSAGGDDQRRRLADALDEASRTERVVGCLLTSGGEHVAFGGNLTQVQLQAVAQRIGHTWRDSGTALIQFISLSEPAADYALYTRPTVRNNQQLTLVAAPDIDAGRLRRSADDMAGKLVSLSGIPARKKAQEPQLVATHSATPEAPAKRSFALIFQPRRSLPRVMQDAVQHALQDVAARAGCSLKHLDVSADLVHIVTRCSGDHGSGWVAQLYKQGVEKRIQDQFGVQAQLWRKGFYATESEQPLSDVELRLFLGT